MPTSEPPRTTSAAGRTPESTLVQKGLPCPDQDTCRSHDAAALYSDGHLYCFSCGRAFRDPEGRIAANPSAPPPPLGADFERILGTSRVAAIKTRKLTQATCKFWDYRVRIAPPNGHAQQLAVYRDDHGRVVGIKIRDTGKDGTDKRFAWVGKAEEQLFGRHLWGSGGRQLTIVEGELDALSVSQANDLKYPVVSVPNGAKEAAKAVRANLEWINTYDRVNLALDMDAKGRDAVTEICALLPPGKAYIVVWPEGAKDASDLMQMDKSEEITRALWNAKPFRPDGIVDARDLTAQCLGTPEWGIPWPWPEMTKWTFGRQSRELVVVGAGFGIGKTDWLAEVVACTLSGQTKDGTRFTPEGFAVFGYEAGAAETKKAIAGKLAKRRFHLPQDDGANPWTHEELVQTMTLMDGPMWNEGGKLFINDSKGSAAWATVKDRIRYLRHAEGIINFAVDPLSAMVEEDEDAGDNERKVIDRLVREAAKLTVELEPCRILIFSHLTRPKEGPPHEEGGQVRGSQFRGSNAIGMFADFVFGLERNTQAESEDEKCRTTQRCVKDRRSGNSTGRTTTLMYDQLAGTLDLEVTTFSGDG